MMGMGGLEVLLILLVGFIVLGPSKMIDATRFIGKAVAQAKGLVNELHQIDVEENMNHGEAESERKDREDGQITPNEEDPVPFQTEDNSRSATSIVRQVNRGENVEDTSSTNRVDE
jgi:Sec-independent protein translocase protein TatA